MADREFDLAEYAEAEVQHVFLSMYNWVRRLFILQSLAESRGGNKLGGANKQATDAMKRDIAAAQEYLVEHEHICSLDNPPVIREYLTASEEDRGIFEVLLKTYKTNTVLKAKEAWYEWKREFLEMVRPDVEAILSGMQEVSSRIITVRHD